MNYILESNHEQGMNVGEVESDSNVFLLILAGSSEISYFAIRTPGVMQRMRREIQDSGCEIPQSFTIARLQSLLYFQTAIDELCECILQSPFEALER